jgi:hypothetical protein
MMMKILKWTAISFAVLLLLVVIGLYFFNRHLPAFIEHQLNTHVEGYKFTVGEAHFFPNVTLEIRHLTMIQTEHPDPPVAQIPSWKLGIQWRQIFHGLLVSDYLIDKPILHITLPQATKEVEDLDAVPLHKKGWRDAVYSFYPWKVNEFKVRDADVTYIDQDPSKPLHLTHLNFRVGNIRNIRYPNDAYPSDLQLDGNIFDTGRIELKGHANFLSEPHAGIDADLALLHVALDPLLPVTERYNVKIHGGVLSANGHLEYTAESYTEANLKMLTIENTHVDYVTAPETKPKAAERRKVAVETAKKLKNKPETLVKVEHAEIKNSEFGLVNKAAKTPYRVYLTKGNLQLENISNQFSEGTGHVKITGLFMGSGNTLVTGKFRPENKGPDFDVHIKIERTELKSLNDLLRAYGNFDVTAGEFSLYSEMTVQNSQVSGYIKPLFKDMKVYDERQDKEKSTFHKLYEGLVGGIAKLLENRPREEVATKTEISGNLDNPQFNTWETIANLLKNAFIKALLPGFEKEVTSKGTKKKP